MIESGAIEVATSNNNNTVERCCDAFFSCLHRDGLFLLFTLFGESESLRLLDEIPSTLLYYTLSSSLALT